MKNALLYSVVLPKAIEVLDKRRINTMLETVCA